MRGRNDAEMIEKSANIHISSLFPTSRWNVSIYDYTERQSLYDIHSLIMLLTESPLLRLSILYFRFLDVSRLILDVKTTQHGLLQTTTHGMLDDQPVTQVSYDCKDSDDRVIKVGMMSIHMNNMTKK